MCHASSAQWAGSANGGAPCIPRTRTPPRRLTRTRLPPIRTRHLSSCQSVSTRHASGRCPRGHSAVHRVFGCLDPFLGARIWSKNPKLIFDQFFTLNSFLESVWRANGLDTSKIGVNTPLTTQSSNIGIRVTTGSTWVQKGKTSREGSARREFSVTTFKAKSR